MKKSAVSWAAAMLMLFVPVAAGALSTDEAIYARDRGSGIVTSIEGRRSEKIAIPRAFVPEDPTATARQFLKRHAGVLGRVAVGEQLQRQRMTDEAGMSRVRFIQKIDGVPVYDGQYTVHMDRKTGVVRASGKLAGAVKVDTRPRLSAEEAVLRARQIWAERHGAATGMEGRAKLFILNMAIVSHRKDDRNYLVWRVTLTGSNPPRLEYLFIDARDGQLRRHNTGMRRRLDRRIVDCERAGGCEEALYAYFYPLPCPGFAETHMRVEGAPLYGEADVDDLYTNLGHIGGYYESLGLNGANGQGGLDDGSCFEPSVTAAYARIDGSIAGECPNAFSVGPAMFFCTGGFTELSVVAHEYTHGVDYYNVQDDGGPYGLEYQDESGALNESFADVMSMGVEHYAYGATDWVEGAYIDYYGWLLDIRRSLRDPKEIPQFDGSSYPDRFNDPAFFCRDPEEEPDGGNDRGGVHSNNMVPSKAAYLTAVGGIFNGCSITGIGIDKQQAIWQLAHVGGYLTVTSDFNAAYAAFMFACSDLYGADSFECTEMTKALQAVELDQPGACSGKPAVEPACAVPTPTPSPTPTPTPTPDASPTPSPEPSPASSPSPAPGPHSDTAMLLLSPNGGETFRVGSRIPVTWRIDSVGSRKLLTLKWSKGGEARWKALKTIRNSGVTAWRPKDIHVSPTARLMVCVRGLKPAARVCDDSDGTFRIVRK